MQQRLGRRRSAEAAEAMEAVEASMEAEDAPPRESQAMALNFALRLRLRKEAEAPPPPPSPVRSIEPNEHGMKWWREASSMPQHAA